MPTKKEIEEAEMYFGAAVERAENVLGSFMEEDGAGPKQPEGCAPFYLEALGAAYAMALCHAFHEGQPKEYILDHLQRFNTSARLSLKANENMIKSTARH